MQSTPTLAIDKCNDNGALALGIVVRSLICVLIWACLKGQNEEFLKVLFTNKESKLFEVLYIILKNL